MGETGRPAGRYRILDTLGNVVAEGTAAECAEQMRCSIYFIYTLVNHKHSYPEYWAIPIDDSPAKRWDAFVTPIRKRYGIPQYVPKEGKK